MSDIVLETKEEKLESPPIKAILSQKSTIAPLGDNNDALMDREIEGDKRTGREFAYSLRIPGLELGRDKDFESTLFVWFELPLVHEPYRPPTGPKVFINTKAGDKLLTENPETEKQVLAEISRQLQNIKKQ